MTRFDRIPRARMPCAAALPAALLLAVACGSSHGSTDGAASGKPDSGTEDAATSAAGAGGMQVRSDGARAGSGGTGGGGPGGSGPSIPAGTGGDAPLAGIGGSSGAGGETPATMSVPCGAGACTSLIPANLPTDFNVPKPCCADPATATCGTIVDDRCVPPSQPDPRCPEVTAPVPGIVLINCCADNGMCGLDSGVLGMGCIDLETLATMPIAAFLPLPQPLPCGGDDAGI